MLVIETAAQALHLTQSGENISHLVTKPTKMACAPSEDSYQPGDPPSLIRVFAVCSVDS